MKKFFIVFFIFLYGCASPTKQGTIYPAPHNDYKGSIVKEHFGKEEPYDFMIRTCKIYGGLDETSIKDLGEDTFFQDVIEFKCNYHGKLQEELNIDGKSSQRLNGRVAGQKCQNLGFEIGSVDFKNCMEELTR